MLLPLQRPPDCHKGKSWRGIPKVGRSLHLDLVMASFAPDLPKRLCPRSDRPLGAKIRPRVPPAGLYLRTQAHQGTHEAKLLHGLVVHWGGCVLVQRRREHPSRC